jgi:hypothetical protein
MKNHSSSANAVMANPKAGPPHTHALLRALSGGDRRSVGESNRAAALILEQPGLISVLFHGLDSVDPVLRMRCADAIEKATAKRPELLAPYKKSLIQKYSKIEQQEVRWHVAPMLSRLPLTTEEEAAVVKLLLSYTNDRSSIVRTMTMQALADIALRSHHLLPEVMEHIQELAVIGTPAMKARSKKLLRALAEALDG